jgi:hypothetical protein
MNDANVRFIALPFLVKLNELGIKYQDVLIYITIRSFFNPLEGYCYPAYETIAKRAGVSKDLVESSVRRLEKAGLFKIERSTKKHTCNRYYLEIELDYFEKIPYQIFDATDLSYTEKAMLICLRQFFHGQAELRSIDSIKKYSALLGLSYKQVHKQYKSLIHKGYIAENVHFKKHWSKAYNYSALTDKINWIYDYGLEEPVSTHVLKVC